MVRLVLLQQLGVGLRSVLHSAIGVVHQIQAAGFRSINAMRKALTASSASSVRPSAQPITRRENASSTTASYTNSVRKANVGDVSDPQLVDRRGRDFAGQVRVDRQVVPRVGGDHEGTPPHAQQIVFAHHPQHAFVVDREASLLQFGGDSSVAVGRRFQRDLLHLDRGFPSRPAWLAAALASDRNRPGSGRSSGTARSRLGLSPRLAGFLQTGIRATDDGWRVMIPEMLQGFF